VAGLESARVNVGTISPLALILMAGGGLWLCLWRSKLRFAGLLVIVAGLILSVFRQTPFLLVERDGKNVVLISADAPNPQAAVSEANRLIN
jgi:competence protein ComEC